MSTWLFVGSEVLRPVISMDWDDIISLVMAGAAIIALFVTKKSKNVTMNKEEVYDADVLQRFEKVWERLGQLETEVTELHLGVRVLTAQLHEAGISPLWEYGGIGRKNNDA